jgi:glycosyltransferase involved in cell wall biosynthesis
MSAKVSTIIPAYNAERSIARAIDSALSQDLEGHEIVVVDDGSTDSTAAILNRYGARIQIVTQANRGVSAARNAGIRRATGRYLALLDADDIFLPNKLRRMLCVLERNSSASLAFSDYRIVAENGVESSGSPIGHAPTMKEMMTQPRLPILPSTWVFTREAFERSGGFCEQFRGASLEDAWMLLLMREAGEFVYIPEALTVYQSSDNSRQADKYAQGLPTFLSLAKERYGSAGKRLIRNTKNIHCQWILTKIAHQMNNGDRLGSLSSFACIARIQPSYILSPKFIRRLFAPQNIRRASAMSVFLFQNPKVWRSMHRSSV